MKKILALILIFLCNFSIAFANNSKEWVDLTHDFSSKTLYWPTADKFRLVTVFNGVTDMGYYYSAYGFSAAEHGGTHMDAPKHFAKNHESVDKVPLEKLIGNGVMIDVSEKALANHDYQISIEDITAWEKRNHPIPDHSIVLLNTGFHRFWPNALEYLGTTQRGYAAIAKLHFPGLDPKAAQWLTDNRKIKAIGIDTASIDFGQTKLYPSHQILTAHDIPIFENVANIDQLPPTGFTIIALPMKIAEGSGAPLRIIASKLA